MCFQMSVKLQCKQCRHVIFENAADTLKTVHNEPVGEALTHYHSQTKCDNKIDDIWHLGDTDLPEWMIESIDATGWMKGKLKCQRCSSNVGSFDFITGVKCPCKKFVIPPVHIVKSKVDCKM